MKNYTTRLYQGADHDLWNALADKAKNATFLFERRFMEYHSDRFADFSLIVSQGEKTVALLPCNRSGNTVFSHQGLTYGGLVYEEKLRLEQVIRILESILSFLQSQGVDTLQIKMLPPIYHLKPAQELEYALFLSGAKLIRRDSLSVIDLSKKNRFSDLRKRGIKKGKRYGLEIREEIAFEAFWKEILIPNLRQKHDASPVHTAAEMEMLRSYFPKNIRQFNVYFKDKIVAGTTIFETKTVAHAQYISADESRDELGSLDFLFDCLITEVFREKSFFDFGTSNEEQGKKLNSGLSYWKESFGAGTVVHDFYEVPTENHQLLKDVLL